MSNSLDINNISKKIPKEDYLEVIPKVLYYMDEPLPDPSSISLYFLSELASKDVKVVMSGEGSDEFFGGYNYYLEEEECKLYNKLPFSIRHFLSKCFEFLPEFRGRNFIVRMGTKLEDEYVGVNKVFSEKTRKKLLSFKDEIKNSEITKEFFTKEENNINKMQKVDIKNWLVKDILLKVDKMTMANSLESRTPYVDKEVFKIASSIPCKYKVANKTTKVALREAAKLDIPNDSYKKKKLGFPVPLREWLKEDDFYNEVKNTINKDFTKEFFNQKYALKLLDAHRRGKKDNYRKIWTIYCFLKWYEIYFINS